MRTVPFDPESARKAIEYCYEQGWTDGLPVVPPSPEAVQSFVQAAGREPGEVIGRMEHLDRACTVQLAAINAVMAGCRPEHFPVVLAAWEALRDEGSAFGGGWQSTTGPAPLLIVNGPARQRLGFNGGGNVFGPGFRANATVGRAIRLILMNVFGLEPQVLDQSTQGTPGKYTLCIAENEEESPWEPLHVEHGHPPESSVVSAIMVRDTAHIDNRHTADPDHLLADVVEAVSRSGTLMRPTTHAIVVLGPEHARLLSRAGYSKADVRRYLCEHCGRSLRDLRRTGRGAVDDRGWLAPEGSATAAHAWSRLDDDHFVRIIASPDDVVIVVAGAGNAGVSTVCAAFNAFTPRRLPGMSVIREAGLPRGG
ncbi:MAG TPA: hypothetical protein VFD49_08725 [Candidatus Dormibacteraeota bacterium]|nr:hypothetical protein [Candidatus Dormibacteraeota bacterium]